MPKQPIFSILTVVYNRDTTIERAIKSVIDQEFNDYEYVIVDGGSTDKTTDIIREYESFMSHWVSEPDKGIYNAMNKGIDLLTGKYVILLNSDDWLEKNILTRINNEINDRKLDCEIICAGMNYHIPSGKVQFLSAGKDRFDRLIASYQQPVRHPATLVPLEIYKRIGKFDESYSICSDEEFILRAYFKHEKFIFLNYAISNMEDGGVSTSKSNLNKIYKEHIRTLKCYSKNRKEFLYLKYRFSLKTLLKKIIPSSILYLYRR